MRPLSPAGRPPPSPASCTRPSGWAGPAGTTPPAASTTSRTMPCARCSRTASAGSKRTTRPSRRSRPGWRSASGNCSRDPRQRHCKSLGCRKAVAAMRTFLSIPSRWALRLALLAILTCASAFAQGGERLAPLLDGLGDHTRPVATDEAMAQRFFDQGLVLAFAFNHAEAARAFREAQRLDPACAMCAWGEALVLGPHVNAPMNPEDVPPAWAALERARAGAASESAVNRALIEALGARYVPEPVEDRSALDRAYADAMREVAARFPGDADVQSLFAEALMDTMPWDYWLPDGSPKPETEELLAVLEGAMALDPDHPMALHLWIHAVEKERPELGVEAAERLGPLVPNRS